MSPLAEPEELYGKDQPDIIVIGSRKFMFHMNVVDGSIEHRVFLQMVDERAPVLALRPAYDADGQTQSDLTAIFIDVDLQHEIEDEFDLVKIKSPTAPTA